ncbi:hypothetical protein ACRALDRAFT_1063439 [Sodiomyces alcalophilus JCM 7366]|uniref:uncharacterized protein n=1 Tax=Sodiomyces alcalophilus JCM 7366 TaxID=591952 RepID=UPI0039B642CA
MSLRQTVPWFLRTLVSSTPSSLESSAKLLTASGSRTADLTPSATPTSDIGSKTEDDVPDNVQIPEGELPLPPRITPGWGISGVLMICTGIIYALVGIKTARIHTFFSTAFLASLGTAVLVLYVTEIPVPLAVQGGYVAAAIFTGIMLGVVATFFKEVTESLGCLLGGFCLSMWLLCLTPGGLIPQTMSRIIFISAFGLGVPALYFVRYIQVYVLIASISLSGATVTVLGIDCFSRAGLKEFWAYLWDLNEDLFPLGTNTYPVTRGIRVEIAAIILISVAGIFSQIRLWRVINRHRAQRDAERAQEQRDLVEEEENIGRRIRAQTDQERQLWEETYGRDTKPGVNSSGSVLLADSDHGEKLNRHAHSPASSRPQSTTKADAVDGDDAPASPRGTTRVSTGSAPDALMAFKKDKDDGVVTIRVAADDTLPAMPPGNSKADPEEQLLRGQDQDQEATVGEVPPAGPGEAYSPRDRIAACSPPVVPLPFKVPHPDEDTGIAAEDERSSVATYASKEYDKPRVTSKRQSITEALSQDARNLPSRASHRSAHSTIRQEDGAGQDQLVVLPAPTYRDVDDRSVAATMDAESLLGTEDSASGASRRNTSDFDSEVTPRQARDQEADGDVPPQSAAASQAESQSQQTPVPSDKGTKDLSTTDLLNVSESSEAILPEGTRDDNHVNAPVKRADMGIAADASCKRSMPAKPSIPGAQSPKSVTSVQSTPLSLTRDRLPHALSRVAMSYRTNEWAKHLSHADLPEPERIQIVRHKQPQPVGDTAGGEGAEEEDKEEAPAPLDVDDLQQTGGTGASASHPATTSDTKAKISSIISANPSRGQMPAAIARNASSGAAFGVERRGTSKIVGNTQPLRGEQAGQAAGNPDPPSPVDAARPDLVARRFSDQTLIGQRAMLLRSRSNLYPPGSATMTSSFAPAIPTPNEPVSVYNQPTHSVSGPLPATLADDDMPMSQRKELIRRHSQLRNVSESGSRPTSGIMYANREGGTVMSTEHLPMGQRYSSVPSLSTRELYHPAVRRQSDLHAGTPVPFLGGFEQRAGVTGHEQGVQRSIDAQRRTLIGLNDAEAQKRERERLVRAMDDRAFTARMQSGDLLEVHRDTLRRMQKQVKEKET